MRQGDELLGYKGNHQEVGAVDHIILGGRQYVTGGDGCDPDDLFSAQQSSTKLAKNPPFHGTRRSQDFHPRSLEWQQTRRLLILHFWLPHLSTSWRRCIVNYLASPSSAHSSPMSNNTRLIALFISQQGASSSPATLSLTCAGTSNATRQSHIISHFHCCSHYH